MISTSYSCKSLSRNLWWGFKALVEARTECQRRPARCRGPQQGPKLHPGGRRTVLAAELCRAAGVVPGTASGSRPCFEPELPLHSLQASLFHFSCCKVSGNQINVLWLCGGVFYLLMVQHGCPRECAQGARLPRKTVKQAGGQRPWGSRNLLGSTRWEGRAWHLGHPVSSCMSLILMFPTTVTTLR